MTDGSPVGSASTLSSTRPAIPWGTVLTFAAVLAAADWFWVIALRGAVGAIERTRDPFVSWLQGAVLLTPVFVFAVLGALGLACRRLGPVPQRPRAVITAGFLVAGAATLAGTGALVLSGAYDLRLQLAQLDRMMPMAVECVDSCVTTRRDATIGLQLKATGFGSVILLPTNVLVVGWLIAVRGGRLRIARSQTDSRSTSAPSWRSEAQLVLVATLVGSATVLAVRATADLLGSPGTALLLLVLATLQLAAAHRVGARPGTLMTITAPLLVVAPLPAGPGGVGLAEGAVLALGLVAAVTGVMLLLDPAWMRRAPGSPHRGKLALVGAVAVTAIGVGGSGLAVFDLGGVGENPRPGNHHLTLR